MRVDSDRTMVLNRDRGSLGWILGGSFSLRGWWRIGTGCPRRLWMPHPWRHPRPGWMWLWAAWSGGWRPCTEQGGWNYCVPFQPRPFYGSMNLNLGIAAGCLKPHSSVSMLLLKLLALLYQNTNLPFYFCLVSSKRLWLLRARCQCCTRQCWSEGDCTVWPQRVPVVSQTKVEAVSQLLIMNGGACLGFRCNRWCFDYRISHKREWSLFCPCNL